MKNENYTSLNLILIAADADILLSATFHNLNLIYLRKMRGDTI